MLTTDLLDKGDIIMAKLLHQGYKVFHIYKDVICTNCDNVNYCVEDVCHLQQILKRCIDKHPNCTVWYELINARSLRGRTTYLCDLKVVYKPQPENLTVKFDTEVVTEVAHTSTGRPYVTGQHRERVLFEVAPRASKIVEVGSGIYAVEGTKFRGSLADCKWFEDKLRTEPECFKKLLLKARSKFDYDRLYSQSVTTTAQKMPKKADSFHRKMSSGNRYNY